LEGVTSEEGAFLKALKGLLLFLRSKKNNKPLLRSLEGATAATAKAALQFFFALCCKGHQVEDFKCPGLLLPLQSTSFLLLLRLLPAIAFLCFLLVTPSSGDKRSTCPLEGVTSAASPSCKGHVLCNGNNKPGLVVAIAKEAQGLVVDLAKHVSLACCSTLLLFPQAKESETIKNLGLYS